MSQTRTRTRRFGLYGETSRSLLTFGGRILVHHDKAQMEYLHPGAKVVEVPPNIPGEQCMSIREHPQHCSVQWTADGDIAGREQFRAR